MSTKLNAVPNANLFNAARAVMSQEFLNRIPQMNRETMAEVSTMITSNQFKGEFNAWQEALFNRIGMTIFHDYTLINPLSKYIYGRMDFGDAIEEIGTDIVKGRTMDYGEEGKSVDPFIKVSPVAKAAYHRLDKPIQYCTSIERDRIKRAFLQEYGLSRLLGMFVNKLYSSANVDTWLMTKSIMAYYLNDCQAANGLPLLPNQKVSVVDVVDDTTAKKFILQVRNVISSMKFPNNVYNPMQIHKTLSNRDLTLFIRADILNTIGVEALATAFHIDQLNMNVSIEEMDDFGVDPEGNGTSDVMAVLAEDNWLLITEQFDDMDTIYNPRGRYWNYFLTRAMSFGVTYFKDCVVFRKPAA